MTTDGPPLESDAVKIERLRKALCEIGRLTRWVGWLELEDNRAAADMRRIQRLAEEATGVSFMEYT